ncbi:cytochrome d ubiquinol oxidase subunit II [Kerstersia gyiorum]|uniref:cytochrome d ubiquinol oxidase subunit II n=1 Tax=Kerstersia gyiorum TaxID=206506 RepID=UPI00209DA262|nr:cytochrome d ubiquinol oxidase subunit II [Kerstersia gyiorum]MCP1634128.1 cytochrome d ubiquinol oxidase subunit II [Kerstersia gyiorum]MCP1637714.1 cytochrome d ubiquinol oxidase subunit II [Kerstersia gyiorum]MCP1670580.1 cytochrome d ubiquinol oxidase subunit II [Kerstersia gyiorum]MCP1678767.1 cytochrome d ubiquinol oxidase subunit II [Kerstersia gyiorum]MCP1683428.1 cytochrome d ubiquinol oxidase subunit II [Kerstersia gyiorum]
MEMYLVLKVVWWVLLGVLLIGLAVMVGMDMGVGTLLRFVGRTDAERRVALNIIGPHWDGNQVWFILGGGAIFAAWPLVYATAFSGFYIVMLVLLWSMIVRPLGFEYRSKMPSERWRNAWDWSLFVSGFVPMLIFGAAIGNVLQGVPFHFDWRLTSYYTGSFLELLNPFAILCGLVSVSMSIYMGGAMLMSGSAGEVAVRARRASLWGGVVALVLFTIGGFWVSGMDGFRIVQSPDFAAAQTPLHQTVERVPGGLLANFSQYPVLWLLPALTYIGVILGLLALRARRDLLGWWLGALAWVGVLGTAGAAMFPFMMPSSTNPSHSLTVWNSGASAVTQGWMLGFTVIFMPLIICYTSWAFWVMRGKVDAKQVENSHHAL